MISVPLAHVGGMPVEETIGSLGPALLVAVGVASAQLRVRLRGMRSRAAVQLNRNEMAIVEAAPLDAAQSPPDAR